MEEKVLTGRIYDIQGFSVQDRPRHTDDSLFKRLSSPLSLVPQPQITGLLPPAQLD